jgi:hypothetical protein
MGIWDLVSDVLREFECEVAPEDMSFFLCHPAWRRSKSQEVSVALTPLLGAVRDDTGDRGWRDAVVIRRVERELGLDFEFDEIGGRYKGGIRRYRVGKLQLFMSNLR